jgi:hypothetical protein
LRDEQRRESRADQSRCDVLTGITASPAHAAAAVVSDHVAHGDWIQDIERPPGGYR